MPHRALNYSMAFLMSLSIAGGMLAVPLLATKIGASDLDLGTIGSAAAITYVFIAIKAGALSVRLGRRRVMIAGALLTGLAFALMPLANTPTHMILLMAACGCGMASFWPALEAWMSEGGDEEEVRRELGAFNVSWSVGGALGPLIGGLIYTVSGSLAFLSAACGTVIVIFLTSLHKKPATDDTRQEMAGAENGIASPDAGMGSGAENKQEPVSRDLLYAAWIANFASWFAVSELRVLFPKLGLALGMQPWVIGGIMFSLGASLTATFYIMGASGRWHTKTYPLLAGQALIVVLLLASLGLTSPVALGLIFAGLGVGFGITYSYSLYCSIVGALNKGEAGGRHETVLGTGALLGPFLGGLAAETLHAPRAPYILGAALVATCLIAEVT